tara:strand:+ start:93 stop:269 length:177 start_codon:yes stop_codon:yes gene_type:complete
VKRQTILPYHSLTQVFESSFQALLFEIVAILILDWIAYFAVFSFVAGSVFSVVPFVCV